MTDIFINPYDVYHMGNVHACPFGAGHTVTDSGATLPGSRHFRCADCDTQMHLSMKENKKWDMTIYHAESKITTLLGWIREIMGLK